MGFFSMITGADTYAGIHNALLMEHALGVMEYHELDQLWSQFPQSAMSGAPRGMGFEEVVAAILGGRLVELNIFAKAMLDLDLPPKLAREKWFSISNPFAVLPDINKTWQKVRMAQADMLRRHGVDIQIPRAPLIPELHKLTSEY